MFSRCLTSGTIFQKKNKVIILSNRGFWSSWGSILISNLNIFSTLFDGIGQPLLIILTKKEITIKLKFNLSVNASL